MVRHHKDTNRVSMTKAEYTRMKKKLDDHKKMMKTGHKKMTVGKRGTKSKTHSGLNFETRKGSKMFDREHHREDHAQGSKVRRRPY
tara:strand:+ start:912 stop:1169 length:258 start_codon:yes stop_codon:yes gene_type:complete